MTVVRLEGGELLLHSPIAASDALRRELDALGRVRYVIAPNRFHHLYAGDYAQAYPESRLFVAPGLERKRRDLVIDSVLCDEAPAGWADELQQLVFRGFPLARSGGGSRIAASHSRVGLRPRDRGARKGPRPRRS
jgi:hypothetical protein